jgi:hypothetical protein
MTQLVVLGISGASLVLCLWVSRQMRLHRAGVKSLDTIVQKLQNQLDSFAKLDKFFLALKAREEALREDAPRWSAKPQQRESGSAEVDTHKSPATAPPLVATNRSPSVRNS